MTTSNPGLRLESSDTPRPTSKGLEEALEAVGNRRQNIEELPSNTKKLPPNTEQLTPNVEMPTGTVDIKWSSSMTSYPSVSDFATPGAVSVLAVTGWGFGDPSFRWTTCILEYNNFLDGSTEMDKWASGVATTLMTVLPSMIAFSPLNTADTQTLYYLDVLATLITCGFTLFFRVDSWTTLLKDKIWDVTDILDRKKIDAIYCNKISSRQDSSIPERISLTQSPILNNIDTGTGATPDRSTPPSPPGVDMDSARLKRLYERGRLEKLQKKVFDTSALPEGTELGSEPTTATSTQNQQNEGLKQPRPYRIIVYMAITTFCVFQFLLFLVISCWVFGIDSTLFVWGCAGYSYAIFVGWVAASFVCAAVVRYASTSLWTRPDEIFHIESIPTTPDCCGENASALSSNPIQERNSLSNWSGIQLAHLWDNLTQFRVLRYPKFLLILTPK
ncbi:hypothetical protein HOY80DRAFT_1112943 [Tuber brumale]|nr:hypothetical protein HOY80DRAFT_1112943 [Tuber brumale]